MPVTADFRKFLPPGKAGKFLKRFREIYAPPNLGLVEGWQLAIARVLPPRQGRRSARRQ